MKKPATFHRLWGILLAGILLGGAAFPAGPARARDLPAIPDLGGETPADRELFFAKTQKETTGIPIGHGRRMLWVYFNPDCSYCHRLWMALLGISDLTAVWIPVTFSLKPSSLARSAAILSAKDPAVALAQNEEAFNDLREEGGYPVSLPLSARAREEVTRNTMLLRLWTGKVATPTLLYRDTRGEVQESIGLPADISGMIATIAPSP
ncbi:MAG: thioredoxin fold domain-containing protein [Nitrospiraceae bacterium]|nr:thioredoxin fold domain-containing protein [Nitrospiraceae bacterium]